MVKCVVLAEIDEHGRVVDLTLKDQVMGLPEHIWRAIIAEKAEFPTPGLRLVEAIVEIEP